jgi:D-alanyl-D-alanine carboxypeptidase/D-alanyl-D-alanine-endopeptidase (penicillin-binding protein 4)
MDPRFNNDDLTAFIESLRRLGVDTIRGNIVADRSFKDEDPF